MPGKPKPELRAIDEAIGKRIRLRRQQLGMSQTELGAKLGVSFQQVQKYEKGTNRISGSRTTQLAAALEVDEAYFFGKNGDERETNEALTLLTVPGALKLLQSYQLLPTETRNQLIGICESLAGNGKLAAE